MELIHKPGQYEIVIIENGKEEVYSLEKAPAATHSLVLQSKQEILQEMSLESVLTNLERSGDLLFVAYNAVAGARGGTLQAKMQGLETTLAKLCSDCVLAMQMFRMETGEVLGYLLKTYRWLLKGREDIALTQLTRCESAAKMMADESAMLAKRFDSFADTTESVLEETLQEQGAQNDKKLATEAQLRDLNAQTKRTEETYTQLMAAAKEMQTLYDEARRREETESKRGFILGITSAITSAMGVGVAAFVAVKNPLGTILSSSANQQADSEKAKQEAEAVKEEKQKAEEAQQEAEEARQEAEEAQQEAEEARQEAEEAQQEAEEAQQEAEESNTPEDKDNAAQKKRHAEGLKKLADTKMQNAKAAEERAQKAKAFAEGLAAALKEASDKTTKMQAAAMKAAQSIREEKLQYLNQKLELQRQVREALSATAEYAERIKNINVDKQLAEMAVESLHEAIRALKQIVTSLLNASLFWRSMEQYCNALSKSQKEEIQDVQVLSTGERLQHYSETDFVATSVYYIARWKALEVICTEYQQAANKARNKVESNIIAAPTFEESRVNAPVLAERLLSQTRQELAQLDSRVQELQTEQMQLAAAA